ncbi:MAG: hypothetical protein M0D57_09905 [Sphingobacteriales bacterium JAD_PAG50586_3]|nr:MAG: hypothetical protein M0D57_09905 [Sphingobacteriales bacterium JAD_PAG50586_3]
MEAQNLIEFYDFKNCIISAKEFANGNIQFPATVEYYYNGIRIREDLNVTLTLTTFEYGKICIDEGNIINSQNHYLDLYPQFQSYKFKNNSFYIEYKSASKIGPYEIVITPL